MENFNEIRLNKSHIPNNPLRVDIVDEVKEYIGYAYADDVHADDYLTIDKTTLAVSHTRCSYGQPREDYLAYYDMSRLLAPGKASFTYEPDELEIDAVVLDFFPIEKLNNFPDLAESAILNFAETRDITDETTLGFPVDTFDPDVYVPSELEVVEAAEEDYIDECAEFVEVPVKKYIRGRGDKLFVNKHKLLILALDNYYGD